MTPFTPLPTAEPLRLFWPTDNHFLFSEPGRFFARTRVNPEFGRPGFTRDCGKRLHRGCDIAPVDARPTGRTTSVLFTDCATGREFASEEPTFVPDDDVFCVADGMIEELVTDESVSDFGRHVVVAHRWPRSGERFLTLYGHLAEVAGVSVGVAIDAGARLGRMGQTSRSADARNWMAIAPHLHFEVRAADGRHYDPEEFLQRYLHPGTV